MDPRELRNVFGSFVTGVTVVTTLDAEGLSHGVTANSFSSVSLDPPLVLWSQATSARSFPAFRDADRFIINILAEHQKELSQRFATSSSDKFAGIETHARGAGVPALPECCAYLECRKVAMYPGGDHIVYLGEVLAIERNARRPLAFAQGKYMVAFEHEMNYAIPELGASHIAHNDVIRLASAALPELSNRLGATLGLAVWGNYGPTVIRWERSPKDGVALEPRAGIVVSPLTSAAGIVFGAYLPEDMTEPIVRDTLSMLQKDGIDLQSVRSQYDQRRNSAQMEGFATSRPNSLRGMTGISVPIFDRSGSMVLALCCLKAEPEFRHQSDGLTASLISAAAELSLRLGYCANAGNSCP